MKIGERVSITDNSGVRLGKCLCIYKQDKSKRTGVGSTILITTTVSRKKKVIAKLDMLSKALIVRSSNPKKMLGGHIIKCDNSAAAILKANGDLIATRVNGLVSLELKKYGFSKILSICDYTY